MTTTHDVKRTAGVWIDRRKAVCVTLTGAEATTEDITSGVDKHTRLAGGARSSTPYGPQDVASESRAERKHQQQLASYFEAVIRRLQSVKASEVLLLGPGETKLGLRKAIEKRKDLRFKVVGVETADKMTHPQISARVRERFAHE